MARKEIVENDEAAGLIAADKVEGTEVYDQSGAKIGTVDSVMIGKRSGKVRYVVLGSGGFLGIGEDRVPLPWSILSYDEHRNGYVVAADRETLGTAPTFRSPDEVNWTDRSWGERVHGHFEASPYWML